MRYSELADVYEELESTAKKLEKSDIIAKLLKKTPAKILPDVVLLLQGKVYPEWSEEVLGVAGQLMIKAIAKATGESAEDVMDIFTKKGDLGLTVEDLSKQKKQRTLFSEELTIEKVFENIKQIAKQAGSGSQDKKQMLIAELIAHAKPKEAKYIVRTVLEELRVGVAEGLIRDAIAKAFNVEPKAVENAWFLRPDYGEIAEIAKEKGEAGLKKVKIEVGMPIHVLLAEKSPDLKTAVESYDKVLLEYKYDGMRTCQPAGSIVLSNPELKEIDKLKVGDKILSSRGKEQNVTEILRRKYTGNILKIKPSNLPAFVLTSDHPIYAIKHKKCHWASKQLCRPNCNTQNQSCSKFYTEYKPEFYEAKDLQKNDFLYVPKYSIVKDITIIKIKDFVDFKRHGNTQEMPREIKVTKELLELFGWYCAEGSSNSKWGNISFALSSKERNYAEFIKKALKSIFDLNANIRERNNGLEVYVRSRILAEFFSKTFGSNAKEKKLPDFILKLPKDNLSILLKSYWKGDGNTDKAGVCLTTASKKLAYSLLLAYSKLGILVSILESTCPPRICKNRNIKASKIFRIRILGAQQEKLDYARFEGDRSWNRFFETDKGFFVPIKNIQAEPFNDFVYNIETEDHTYTNPFVLHNCIHKKGDKIWLFTRRLENVTAAFPDLVKLCKENIRARECILDSETVGVDKNGKPVPFQLLSTRIKRKHEIEASVGKIPIISNLFDIIYLNGEILFDEPLWKRKEILEKSITEKKGKFHIAEGLVTKDLEKAEKFYKEALKAGQEGLIVKNLDAKYQPGRRVAGGWLKVKPVMESLDLVIVGATWGAGKRAGTLGSFFLALRDPSTGKFLECGMMGSGVKEKRSEAMEASEMTLKELTKELKPLIEFEKGNTVKIKPKIIVEVAYEEIQKSPTYESGYALRFPRLVRLRPDKALEEVDTKTRIKRLYEQQKGKKK